MKSKYIVYLIITVVLFNCASKSNIDRAQNKYISYRSSYDSLKSDSIKSFTIKRGDRVLSKDGMKNIDELIDYYELNKKNHSDSFLFQDDLATLYFVKKDYISSLKQFKLIKENFPYKNISATLKISRCYEELDKFDFAITLLKNELELCGTCSIFNVALANIFLRIGNYSESFYYFEQVDSILQIASMSAINNYAFVCSILDTNLTEAEFMATYAIKNSTFPKNFYMYDTLGDIQFDSKKYKEAKLSYEKVLEYFPMSEVKDKLDLVIHIIEINSKWIVNDIAYTLV